jgi:hypothetical protein
MTPPHHTLRISDIFPPHAQSLRAQNAPHPLHLTFNARGAFYQLLKSLPSSARKLVLLPAFHCTALVEPVVQAGYRPIYYRIRRNFTIDLDDVRTKLTAQTALTVVVHFFGFPAEMDPVLEMARARGCFVVEDCAHSFLSRAGGSFVGHRGDFALFSYHKFAPSLMGGGLGVNLGSFTLPSQNIRASLLERMVIAKRLVEQVSLNSEAHILSKVFLRFNKLLATLRSASNANEPARAPSVFVDDPYLFREDLACATLPSLCQIILESCDWNKIVQARQWNYRLLSRLLKDTPSMQRVLPYLPDSVVPWAFPVFLQNRPRYEHSLRRIGVPLFTFGELLHPSLSEYDDGARQEAEYISRELLLLPVHAQISESQIASYAKLLGQYAGDVLRGAEFVHAGSEE